MKRVYRLAPLRGFVAESESYYTFMAEQGYRLQRTGWKSPSPVLKAFQRSSESFTGTAAGSM